MAKPKEEKLHKIEVTIKLFSGGQIGIVSVVTPEFLNLTGRRDYLEQVVNDSIRKCVDHLILEGSRVIANKK